MDKLKKSDKIFEDLLEDDFVDVFRVGFSIQRVFGMLGVHLKHKFITPPTTLYKTYSVIIWLVNLTCIMYTINYCSTLFDPLSTDIPLKMGILINGVINTGLAWKSTFNNGQLKCQLYVKLQKIERVMKMKNAKRLNRKSYLISSVWATISVVAYTLWVVVSNKYLMRDFCPSEAVASVASSASFMVIFHIYTILKIINLRVQYVNNALAQVNGGNSRLSPNSNGSQKEFVYSTSNAEVATNSKIGNELVHGMSCILDSFADTMDVFQHAIFFFTWEMLVWQLITMQNLVVTFKKQMTMNIPSFLCTLPSSLVFMVLMLTLCFTSQTLTNRLEACGELCTAIISTLDEGETRENAKRIIILLKGRRPATVFDIYNLNTQLPFHLLAITASYTIVLLQFAAL